MATKMPITWLSIGVVSVVFLLYDYYRLFRINHVHHLDHWVVVLLCMVCHPYRDISHIHVVCLLNGNRLKNYKFAQ